MDEVFFTLGDKHADVPGCASSSLNGSLSSVFSESSYFGEASLQFPERNSGQSSTTFLEILLVESLSTFSSTKYFFPSIITESASSSVMTTSGGERGFKFSIPDDGALFLRLLVRLIFQCMNITKQFFNVI